MEPQGPFVVHDTDGRYTRGLALLSHRDVVLAEGLFIAAASTTGHVWCALTDKLHPLTRDYLQWLLVTYEAEVPAFIWARTTSCGI